MIEKNKGKQNINGTSLLAKVGSQVQRVDWEGGGWKGNRGHDVNELRAVMLLGGEGCVPRVGFWKSRTYL